MRVERNKAVVKATLTIYSFLLFLQVFNPVNSNLPQPDVSKIKFYLYPKHGDFNFRQEIKIGDLSSLRDSSYKHGAVTVILIHGWTGSPEQKGIKDVRYAYINSTYEDNYIAVDWSALAGQPTAATDVLLYPFIVENTVAVGKHVGHFIAFLIGSGALDLTRTHVVGLSLGAHVAGVAGKETQTVMSGFKIARITGLDPAGPLYWPRDPARNIDKGDAAFVDIIHTDQYFAGEFTTEGHVDFIVNHGKNQPGCDFLESPFCSHGSAARVYAVSFKISYFGCQCEHWELGPVEKNLCLFKCQNPVRVGLYTPHDVRGVFAVDVPELPDWQ